MKKYFILSDIHAQYNLLLNALKKSKFDMEDDSHVLIIAGDILDRGEQGDDVIRFIEKLIIKNRVQAVIGNHDIFLIDVLNGEFNLDTISWNINKNGFITTLKLGWDTRKHFKLNIKNLDTIRKNFLEMYPVFSNWLINNPIFLEYPKHVIVHAFLDFSLENWRDTDRKFAVWERRYNDKIPDYFNKTLIFGHTPNSYINKQNELIYLDKKIMLDGGAAGNIQINIIVLTEDEI